MKAIQCCAKFGYDLCINDENGQYLAVIKYYTASENLVLSLF